MSETAAKGPLDILRGIAGEANELDVLAQEKLMDQPEMVDDFQSAVFALDEGNPLIDKEVIVYGTPLTISMDDLDTHPFVLPRQRKEDDTPAHGKYGGLTLREVYDSDTGTSALCLVHMIYTGSSPRLADAFGNLQQTHFFDYILVKGSEMVPMLPFDAHSTEDLTDDRLVEEVDEIAFDETLGTAEKIHRLCFLNRAMANLEGQYELNRQRISYINSLGLLENVQVLTNDLIFASKAEPHQIIYMTELPQEPNTFTPDMFDIAPGYDRLTDDILLGGSPELYVRVDLADDQILLAPLKNILDIEAAE